MSRSQHHGKGFRKVKYKPDVLGENEPILGKMWGSTFRIRHRHRQFWARLLSKRRRQQDHQATKVDL